MARINPRSCRLVMNDRGDESESRLILVRGNGVERVGFIVGERRLLVAMSGDPQPDAQGLILALLTDASDIRGFGSESVRFFRAAQDSQRTLIRRRTFGAIV